MEDVAYYRPGNLAQFVELMETHRKDTTLIAGGTNLIPEMRTVGDLVKVIEQLTEGA